MILRELLAWGIEYLKSHLSESDLATPRLEVELIMTDILGCSRSRLYCIDDKPISDEDKLSFERLVARRALGEPIAYLLGKKEFFGDIYNVNQNTLIPRSDTEILVELVLEDIQANKKSFSDKPRLLDVGTGSGCIAISISKNSELDVEAWDVSSKALKVAEKNAAELDAGVRFLLQDLTDRDAWDQGELFDYIVSNPPYISKVEFKSLSLSVKNFEPESALLAEDSGLYFYKIIAESARARIKLNGKLFLEIGASQGTSVTQILQEFGWKVLAVKKDLSGHDRVVIAEFID